MNDIIGRLTVCFENPFWVGIFERIEDGKLYVSKITFGAEPKDYDVYAFVLKNYNGLRFSQPIEAFVKSPPKNPKRAQREIKRQLKNSEVGTKSQQALKLQHESNKEARIAQSKEQKQRKIQRLFMLKQQRKKKSIKGIKLLFL